MRRLLGVAALVGALTSPAGAAPAAQETVAVMTLNVFYGGDEIDIATGSWCEEPAGCSESLQVMTDAIAASGADIVGIAEPDGNTRAYAERLGWYHHERTSVISRFPLIDPPAAAGLYVLAEVAPGRVVAIANIHLPSDPYGPYLFRDGATRAEVIRNERETRLPFLAEHLATLPGLAEAGIPVFLVGDFNSPSHLDWTAATAAAWGAPYRPFRWPVGTAVAAAGFTDSYRVVHPDPADRPGYTWTPGGPESVEDEVHDRIDWVMSAGPARAVSAQVVGEVGGPDVDVEVESYTSDHRGVVSGFVGDPAPLPVMAAVGERRLDLGEPVEVRYRASAGSRVTLVEAGGDRPLLSRRVSARPAGDTLALPTQYLDPGAYEVVLTSRTGRELSRTGVWLYAPGTPTTVSTAENRYEVGDTIEVSWANAPGMHWDWLGVYVATDEIPAEAYSCKATGCGSYDYLLYEYTDSAVEGVTGIVADLEPGTYQVRFLSDDGYLVYAVSDPFEVVAPD